jgi:hypothetical protein
MTWSRSVAWSIGCCGPTSPIPRSWSTATGTWSTATRRGAGSCRTATGPTTARLLLDAWRPLIENWDEVAVAVIDRIAADLARYSDDETLLELHRSIAAAVQGEPQVAAGRAAARVVCPRFRIDGQLVRTLTVVARFESAVDVTLDELRVELVYPQDDASDRFFHEIAR